MSISFADTLSSDVGIFFKHKTYDIISLRPIKAGLSGGVSFIGTLAGIIGAVAFALLVGYIFELDNYDKTVIAVAGALGMLIDSILGSLFQAKYVQNNHISEEKTKDNNLIKGVSWLHNDGVNFLANTLVTSLLILFLVIN